MTSRYLFTLLCALISGAAQAEIYKYKDSKGHVTYSSVPLRGAKRMHLDPLPTMTPYRSGNAGFPSVDQATQRNRDDARRRILQDELSSEEKLLSQAQQNLREKEANPGIPLGPDSWSNAALIAEQLKPLQAEVSHHEKNVESLKTELSRLK